MLVSLDSVLSAPRPTTYTVRDGQLHVRIDEAEKVVRALAKKVKKLSNVKLPEPPKPTTKATADAAADAKRAAAAKVAADAAEKNREKTAQEKRATTIARKRREAAKPELAATKARRMADRKASVKAVRDRVEKKSAARAADKAGQINAQLAHCILAVHFKRKKSVRGAWNICRASLTKYGYLKGPYREGGKVSDVRPTQKGARRAMQHATEKHPLNGGIPGAPNSKFQKFRNLFREIEPTV